jgi:hypothetical protein
VRYFQGSGFCFSSIIKVLRRESILFLDFIYGKMFIDPCFLKGEMELFLLVTIPAIAPCNLTLMLSWNFILFTFSITKILSSFIILGGFNNFEFGD